MLFIALIQSVFELMEDLFTAFGKRRAYGPPVGEWSPTLKDVSNAWSIAKPTFVLIYSNKILDDVACKKVVAIFYFSKNGRGSRFGYCFKCVYNFYLKDSGCFSFIPI